MQLDPELLRKTGAFGLVSTELAVYVGGGFLLGRFLDDAVGSRPIACIVFTLLGLFLAIRRIAKWYAKEVKSGK